MLIIDGWFVIQSKKGKCEFSFVFGNKHSFPENILESKGRKQVRSIAFEHKTDVDEDLLSQIIFEAIKLNEFRFLKNLNQLKRKVKIIY